mmetsp:Transcript_19886/g.36676  ORF Transcript_19886/g.36676 Transcript_19886/m.36676 type:complete len:411 (+) Transcript_19886:4259-5491(+)
MQKEVRAFEDKLRQLFFNLYSQIQTPEAELKALSHKRQIRTLRPISQSPHRTALTQKRSPSNPSPSSNQRRSFSSIGKVKLQTSLQSLDTQVKRIAAGHTGSLSIETSPARRQDSNTPDLLSPLPQYSYTTGRIEETKTLPSISEVSLVDKIRESETAKAQRKIDATYNKIKAFATHLDNLKIYAKVAPGKVWRSNREDLSNFVRVHTRRDGIILDKAVKFRRKTKDSRVKADSGTATPKKRVRSFTVEPLMRSQNKPKKIPQKSFVDVQTEQDSKLNLLLSRIQVDRSRKLSEKLVLLKKVKGYGAEQDLRAIRRIQEKRRKQRASENAKQQKIYSRAVVNLRYVAHELSESVVKFLNSIKAALEAGDVLKEEEFSEIFESIGPLPDEESSKTAKSILRQFGVKDSIIN